MNDVFKLTRSVFIAVFLVWFFTTLNYVLLNNAFAVNEFNKVTIWQMILYQIEAVVGIVKILFRAFFY